MKGYESNMKISDIIELAKLGYKPGDIKELLSMETDKKDPEPDDKKDPEPDDKKDPEPDKKDPEDPFEKLAKT